MNVRELPADEWHRLRGAESGIWANPDLPLPNPENAKVVVAEDGDRIIAHWVMFTAVHLEAAWMHDDYRTRPRLLLDIIGLAFKLLRESGAGGAFTVASGDAASIAEKLGFTALPGTTYFILFNNTQEEVA